MEIVKNNPEAVKKGVDKLILKNISPDYIREKTLKKIKIHRENFIKLIQDIYQKERVNKGLILEFNKKSFHNKSFYKRMTQWKKIEARNIKEI